MTFAHQNVVAIDVTDEQAKLALTYIGKTSAYPVRDELFFWLRAAGLRALDIYQLPISALVEADGSPAAKITASKYCSLRAVPIAGKFRKALTRFQAAYPAIHILGEAWGNPFSGLQERLNEICTAARFSPISPPAPRPLFKVALAPAPMMRIKRTPAPLLEPLQQPTASQTTVRRADLVRAVRAAQAVGLEITATEVGHDGTIKLSHAGAAPNSATAYERWKEGRDADPT